MFLADVGNESLFELSVSYVIWYNIFLFFYLNFNLEGYLHVIPSYLDFLNILVSRFKKYILEFL